MHPVPPATTLPPASYTRSYPPIDGLYSDSIFSHLSHCLYKLRYSLLIQSVSVGVNGWVDIKQYITLYAYTSAVSFYLVFPFSFPPLFFS